VVPNIGVAQRVGQRVWWIGVPWFPWEIGIELLIAGLTLCCFGDYRAWPSFECLDGSHGAIPDDPRDEKKLYIGISAQFSSHL
jgi:hypothetical protein